MFCLSMELLIINILSTPMAKTKNGITSPLIIVKPTPKYEIIPIEEITEAKTINMPTIARENPEVTVEGNLPMATPMYISIAE